MLTRKTAFVVVDILNYRGIRGIRQKTHFCAVKKNLTICAKGNEFFSTKSDF